jgi:hypothetical protein
MDEYLIFTTGLVAQYLIIERCRAFQDRSKSPATQYNGPAFFCIFQEISGL